MHQPWSTRPVFTSYGCYDKRLSTDIFMWLLNFQIVQEYTTEESAGREKWIQMIVYWTASTVLRVEVTEGKLWFDGKKQMVQVVSVIVMK